MKIYVGVTVYAGCVDKVEGFGTLDEAKTFLAEQQRELGIMPGEESESQHDAQLHELDIDVLPPSVRVRRTVW